MNTSRPFMLSPYLLIHSDVDNCSAEVVHTSEHGALKLQYSAWCTLPHCIGYYTDQEIWSALGCPGKPEDQHLFPWEHTWSERARIKQDFTFI